MVQNDPSSHLPVAADLDRASQILFRLGRAFSRLPRQELLPAHLARGAELSAILVVQAVETAAREQAGGEVTVGAIAAELGVDPSTASRLVAQAVRDELLSRDASARDGRASVLALTAAGSALGEAAASYQRAVFEKAMADWSPAERRQFARLFVRFAAAIMADLERGPRA